jgi:hypothetical protein
MDSIRHQQLLELDTRYNELHRFYFGEDHQRINGTLSVDELKQADKIRRRIKKLMSLLYKGYYPSMGGFSQANYIFIFKNKEDAEGFVDEIMPISVLYKRYTLKKLNKMNYKVTLNIFSSDEAFMDHIEKRIGLKG